MKAKIFIGPEASGKTRMANMISEIIGKEKTATICGATQIMKSKYVFSNIPEDTQLLVIDDLPMRFNFHKFTPVIDNKPNGENLTFSIRIEKRGQQAKIIQVPYLIFTTNHMSVNWHNYESSFRAHFDIVEFPLSEFDDIEIDKIMHSDKL